MPPTASPEPHDDDATLAATGSDDEVARTDDPERDDVTAATTDAAAAAHDEGSGLVVRVGAEAAASFVLVLAVLGVALYSGISGVGSLGAALAGGLALTAVVATFGPVSGGHAIPAVTLAAAIAGRLRWADVVPYWLAQLIGAVTAAAVVFLTVPPELPGLLQHADARAFLATVANQWGQESTLWAASGEATAFDLRSALLVEIVGAAVLAGVALTAGLRSRGTGPLAAGAAFAVLTMLAAPVTGASLNPARSTAAAIFADGAALEQLWLFWVAPLVGAAVAGLLHRAFAPHEDVLEEVVLVDPYR
ncbi:MIP family channel protein [Cellulomonas sp. APG4]|uniref:MIP/aquaporin family protein n=1 Tax=Cellulomonas sp. APG4 TaxID=1538656 RepID=UPI00137AB732|nr:aquaporin [Cellulomonas sp. APG4]NCT89583.1 MIP family channel protein [Cellulomonas sp. APG4]